MVDASSVPEPEPPKSLSERVAYAKSQLPGPSAPLTKNSANPKAQPKSAIATKATTKDATKGRIAGRTGKLRRRDKNRPKPKTAEELDAEMTDYFAGNNANSGTTIGVTAAAVNGGGQPAANTEDLGMEEISVDSIELIT